MLSDTVEAPEYIILPSNSDTFPDNKTGSYRVQLPFTKNFEDGWEVALTEFAYPKSYSNIQGVPDALDGHIEHVSANWVEDDPASNDWIALFFMGIPGYQGKIVFRLPTGYYATIDELLDVINKRMQYGYLKMFNYLRYDDFSTAYAIKPHEQLATIDRYRLTFVYNKTEQRVVMYIPKAHYTVTQVKFARGLQHMLGFIDTDLMEPADRIRLLKKNSGTVADAIYQLSITERLEKSGIIASHPPDIAGAYRVLYVYCDVVDKQVVGNVLAPLLRTIPTTEEYKFGDTVTCTFHTPYYVPLRVKSFGTIEIEIKDDYDRLIPFMFGKSVVTLHFRKRKITL